MGQTDSKENSKLQLLFQSYHTIKTFHENDSFGESKLLQSKKNPKQRLLLKEIIITDDVQFTKANRKYENRSKLYHQNIVNVTNHFYLMDQQLCGQFYKIFIALEYFENSLSDYIHRGLRETELWPLLTGTIKGLCYLQENSIHHNCLTLRNIYIDANQMIVKVADPAYFTQISLFTQTLQDPTKTKNIYLAPLLVQAIYLGNWQPKHNYYKSDVFSLGMIILHAALNQSCNDLYSYEDGIFRENDLMLKINGLKLSHSELFVNILSKMLHVKEEYRPDFIQLAEIIKNIEITDTQKSTRPANLQISSNQAKLNLQPKQLNVQDQNNLSSEPQHDQEHIKIAFPNDKLLNLTIQHKNVQSLHHDNQQRSLYVPQNSQQNHELSKQTSQSSFHINTNLYQQTSHQNTSTPNNQSYATLPHQNILNQQSQLPLPKDFGDTSHAKYTCLDIISRPSLVDENADPNDEEMNQLRATQKHDDPLWIKKSNLPSQDYQPLQDFTNLFQRQDQCQAEHHSKTYDSYQQENKYFSDFDHQLLQNAQLHKNIKSSNKDYQLTNNNTKEGFSLPFDLPCKPIAYNVKYTEYEVSNQFEDRKFMNNFISEQKPTNWQPKESQIGQTLLHSYQHQNSPYIPQYGLNQQFNAQYDTQQQMLSEYVVEHHPNGSKYEGEKLDGLRHGPGKFYYQDGGLYDGGWNQNKMHGRGVLYYATGKPAYDGDWMNDKFQGFGTLYNETPMELPYEFDFRQFDQVDDFWIKYQGYFNEDNKEGQGTLFLSNGERFVGSFLNDYISGTGLFYCSNGRVVDGLWSNNKLI